jgi:hypothetical protein
MDGAGEQGDVDRTRAGWFEDIPLNELPLLRGGSRWNRESSRHRTEADTQAAITLIRYGDRIYD